MALTHKNMQDSDDSAYVRMYVQGRYDLDIQICDMQRMPNVLYSSEGREFREVKTNIWAENGPDSDALYLSTGRHNGGIMLRLLFVKIDGVWRNALTGKKVSFTPFCC